MAGDPVVVGLPEVSQCTGRVGARRRLPEGGRDIKNLEHEVLHRNSSALV